MAFWGADLSATDGDPKRKFRWRVSFGGPAALVGDDAGIIWFAKTVSKPEMTVGDTEHKWYGHTFKYPGSISWNDCELTLVDPVSPDAAKQTLGVLHAAGYRAPDSAYKDIGENVDAFMSMAKGGATAALSPFIIEQLDANGGVIEKWQLHNPFVSKVGFNDLDYGSDDLSEISMTVKYDWADWSSGTEPSGIFKEGYTPNS